MKKVLTIAGSDSGGGAGIQADLKTITILGEYGLSVIVALTAQNTLGVAGIHEPPLDFIELQLKTVLDDIGADAAKTGMLSSPDIVRTVARAIRHYAIPNLVVDPVMVATSGSKLLTDDAVDTIVRELFPLATVITPNLAEASILCGFLVDTLESMQRAATKLKDMGPRYVLIKGGHLTSEALDILYDGQEFHQFSAPMLPVQSTHGSGCTLSAAIATYLAQELSIQEAIGKAKVFITKAIEQAHPIGAGHGPTNPYAHILSNFVRIQFNKTDP